MDREYMVEKLRNAGLSVMPEVQTIDKDLKYNFITYEGAGTGIGSIFKWPALRLSGLDKEKREDIRALVEKDCISCCDFGNHGLRVFVKAIESCRNWIRELLECSIDSEVVYCLYDAGMENDVPRFYKTEEELSKAFVDKYCFPLTKWEEMSDEEVYCLFVRLNDGIQKLYVEHVYLLESISEKVRIVQRWVNDMLNEIHMMKREVFQKILLYSVIDSFAQNMSSYRPWNNADAFCDFILKYSKKYGGLLKEVCPVTLYNYYHEDCPRMGEIKLPESRVLVVGYKVLRKEAERLLACFEDEVEKNKAAKKHMYCSLLFADRNKLVHELRQNGLRLNYMESTEEPLPHMVQGGKMIAGHFVDASWTLCIPIDFVENLLRDVVDGYLSDCEKNKIRPFGNNHPDRLSELAYYD